MNIISVLYQLGASTHASLSLRRFCLGIIAATVIVIFICLHPSSIRTRRNVFHSRLKKQTIKYLGKLDTNYDNKIRIWTPNQRCEGSFTTSTFPKDTKYNNSIPYAILREVVLDQTSYLRSSSFDQIFLSLFITTHISARILPPFRTSSSIGSVHSVDQIDHFLNLQKPYQLGDTNKRKYSVSEWRVSVSLPRSEILTFEYISLSLPLKVFNGTVVQFNPRIHKSCITGFNNPLFDELKSSGSCLTSSKAVLFGGKAIYNNNSTSAEDENYLFKELAHFTARALFGQLQFSTVVMPVNIPYSQSELQHGRHLQAENEMYLKKAALEVRKELTKLGLWSKFPKNGLILLPTCTLGTASKIHEKCSLSSKSGQYTIGYLLYSLFSQYFKWSVSMDMDEYLHSSDELRNYSNIVEVLDKVDKQNNLGYFTIKWFSLLLPKDKQTQLTKNIISNRTFELEGRINKKLNTKQCLNARIDMRGRELDATGKSALRCDTGQGFRVHSPVLLRKNIDKPYSEQLIYPHIRTNGTFLRTWHTRKDRSLGPCVYKSPQ